MATTPPTQSCSADWLHDVVSALAYSFAESHGTNLELAPPHNDLTQFILTQFGVLPDYLRTPMMAAAMAFDTAGLLKGSRFSRQPPEQRAKQLAAWRGSQLSPARDFIRYCESLATFALYSRSHAPPTLPLPEPAGSEPDAPNQSLRSEIVVIGSGPGGAITACLLAEAGHDVLLIEEGEHLPLTSCEPFSLAEMRQKYRNGGQTVAFGKTKIAYVEGRCVGGGSEINSGLYHRTPPEVLERWQKEFRVEALREADLSPHFAAGEQELCVSPLPHRAPPASLKLAEGAARLGWKSLAVPRWFRYEAGPPGSVTGRRQSMTETFIPRFLRAGGRLLTRTRALRFHPAGSGWLLEAQRGAHAVEVFADKLFLCAGAIHTPALLRRSGVTRNVGNSLHMHPTVKLVAQFPEAINIAGMGVPVHQVKEFAPRLSFGCSISSLPHLALALLDHPSAVQTASQSWPQLATYYAMITSESQGSVRPLPGVRDPLVRYRLTETDRRNLADGLRKLAELLFAAGATTLYPSLESAPLKQSADLGKLPEILPTGRANLMTIHLMSSCPMGEDREQCATDSFGRVHGCRNLFVNDASLLCTAPGVNPQGTIMALARRNALHLLEKL